VWGGEGGCGGERREVGFWGGVGVGGCGTPPPPPPPPFPTHIQAVPAERGDVVFTGHGNMVHAAGLGVVANAGGECSVLQCVAVCCSDLDGAYWRSRSCIACGRCNCDTLMHYVNHCNTLQHAATMCNNFITHHVNARMMCWCCSVLRGVLQCVAMIYIGICGYERANAPRECTM